MFDKIIFDNLNSTSSSYSLQSAIVLLNQTIDRYHDTDFGLLYQIRWKY